MRRFFLRFLLACVCLAVAALLAAYLCGGWLLNKATARVLPGLMGAISGADGTLRRVEYEDTEIAPFATAHWTGVAIEATPPANSHLPKPIPVRVRIASARVELTGVFPPRADIHLDGIRVDAGLKLDAPEDVPFGGDEFEVPLQRIDGGSFVLPCVFYADSLRASLRKELPGLREFLRDGATPRRLELSARLHFKLHEVPMSLRLETVRENGLTQLRINRRDLDTLSERYDRPLTLRERELLAVNPLKAPVLLRIKEYAERTSRRLGATDRAYNEDSTRHVLWSYWLTRTFGTKFAIEVTEAHEIGSDNTPQESARDRHNNELGRGWAETQRTEVQLLNSARTDPRVMR